MILTVEAAAHVEMEIAEKVIAMAALALVMTIAAPAEEVTIVSLLAALAVVMMVSDL